MLALAGLLLAAGSALAAAHLRSGALYTGKDSDCGSSVPGTTCVFKFRAAKNGMSLRFVGKSVIDTWGCQGGGGEAILGGKVKGATPIPLIKVGKTGKLLGRVSFVVRPTGAPPQHETVTVTGHLTHAGKGAVITIHLITHYAGSPCKIQPVTLTQRGSPGH